MTRPGQAHSSLSAPKAHAKAFISQKRAYWVQTFLALRVSDAVTFPRHIQRHACARHGVTCGALSGLVLSEYPANGSLVRNRQQIALRSHRPWSYRQLSVHLKPRTQARPLSASLSVALTFTGCRLPGVGRAQQDSHLNKQQSYC